MGIETTISKLKKDYQLSFKNVEPYGSLTEKIFNIYINKEDYMSLYKPITSIYEEVMGNSKKDYSTKIY